MKVVDEISGELLDYDESRKIIIGLLEDGTIIYGFTNRCVEEPDIMNIGIKSGFISVQTVCSKFFKDTLFFSNRNGIYMSRIGMNRREINIEKETKGKGGFPYRRFARHYEAIESFDIFKGKQHTTETKKFPLANKLKYTFGLEFETSAGYVPEDECFRTGLIPLRDGSISGLEYSTVVLQGNEGLELLSEQIMILRKYTVFDKECSLHIHFGNYPLDPLKIFNLYKVCKGLEHELTKYLPYYTFNTAEYKATGKDYCKKLPMFTSFQNMYQKLVGRQFFGDLTQPHPNDITRERKWQIHTRYYWINFINMICYGVNKTVEFRFLRPSYNLKKILVWMYIFNGILSYSEKRGKPESLEHILRYVYDKKTATTLVEELKNLEKVSSEQYSKDDFIGARLDIENEHFQMDEII